MRVYLDHNATTPQRPEVSELLARLAREPLGNPSSLHAAGRRARHAIDEARERVAAALGVDDDEVVFTSGGTESNNLALTGALTALEGSPGLVTSAVEHSAVLATARALEASGTPLRVVEVDAEGRVDAGQIGRAARDAAAGLVSVQAANNEIGVVQPLAQVARALGELPSRPLLHTDAVQALGRIPLPLRELGVDLASFSAHKVGGPLGVGILFRRQGVALQPLLHGGEQEASLRPGTENAAGIAGRRARHRARLCGARALPRRGRSAHTIPLGGTCTPVAVDPTPGPTDRRTRPPTEHARHRSALERRARRQGACNAARRRRTRGERGFRVRQRFGRTVARAARDGARRERCARRRAAVARENDERRRVQARGGHPGESSRAVSRDVTLRQDVVNNPYEIA